MCTCRQIDADRARQRMRRRKRDQVACSRTTDFEHPGAGDVGWIQSERPRDRGKLSRCRLGVCVRFIRRFVIGNTQVVDRTLPAPGSCPGHSHCLKVVYGVRLDG